MLGTTGLCGAPVIDPRFPKPAAAVVEVGAGVGYIMQTFAARTEVSKVVGLDVSAGMIAHARQRIARWFAG